MSIRAPALALLLLALLAAPSRADDPVELVPRLDASTRWKVEQTLELGSQNKGRTSIAGGAGTAQMLVKGQFTLEEKWTDEGTKEEDGRLVELKRTVSSSKMKAQKGPSKATALHRTTLVFDLGEDGQKVRATKGTLPDLCKKLLEIPPLDPVQILLPREPVKVGDTWEIEVLEVTRFQRLICVGVAGAEGEARQACSLLIESLSEESPASAAKIVIGKLVSVKGDVATVAFEDDKTHDDVTDAPQKGPLFDIPASTTKIKGTLTFDLAKGRPVKLEWSQLHDVGDFTPGPNVPGGNVTVPGFTEIWKLVKTWK